MATSNCPSLGPRDSLRRDSLTPVGIEGDRLVLKLVVGALGGLALAVAAALPVTERQGGDAPDRSEPAVSASSAPDHP